MSGEAATRPQSLDGMERLDFVLPEFTRLAWVSDRAEQVWRPRLDRIAAARAEIEWRSVLDGVRACAVTMASPEEFLTLGARWAEVGLNALPVEMQGVSGQPYTAAAIPAAPGQPFVFRFVLGRPTDVTSFKAAWDEGDQEAIGDHLGYPSCCRAFFEQVWVDHAMVDTTWPMALQSNAVPDGTTTIEVSGAPHANILWRWMDVRAVPHLPCRFDCPETTELGERLVAVGRAAGFDQEMDWLVEVLSWPVEWSALHGIAEVKTPVLKVSTRTDATARRHVVRRRGDSYPSEGVNGLAFPFEAPVKLRLTRSRGYRRGLENAVRFQSRPDWYFTDNGFPSLDAMRTEHQPVVDAVVEALESGEGSVVDLGCGNGALLEQARAAVEGLVPFGIDLDPQSIEHAHALHPRFTDHFLAGNLFDDDRLWSGGRRFAVALLMPGRLLEMDSTQAARLRRRLARDCERLVVYAYGDWLSRFGDLAGLAGEAGFTVVEGSGPTASRASVSSLV